MKHFHIKRLQRVLDNVHAHLKAWKQGSWMETPDWNGDGYSSDREAQHGELIKIDTRTCGTAGCLAGWGAVDAGATFVAHPGDFLELVAPRGHVRAVLRGDEAPVHVRYFARSYFGLTDEQASAQFDSDNPYERLWGLAMFFTGGRLTLPAEVTAEQAEGARKKGSGAYATDNFPEEVHSEMEDLLDVWAVSQLSDEQRDAALHAAQAQAEARHRELVEARRETLVRL